MKELLVFGVLCLTLAACIHVHVPQDYVEVEVCAWNISIFYSIFNLYLIYKISLW